MPVLGVKRYNGTVALIYHPETAPLPCGLDAKFERIQISPSYKGITGRLHLNSQLFRYDSIKVCLQLHLKLSKQGKNERAEIDMLPQCPIETMLTSCKFVELKCTIASIIS